MPAKVQVEQTGVFLQKPDFEAAEAAFYASGGKAVKKSETVENNLAPANVAASSAPSKKNRKKTKSKSEEETPAKSNVTHPVSSIASDIKQVREQINQTLGATSSSANDKWEKKFQALELENKTLKKTVDDLVSRISKLETRLSSIDGGSATSAPKAKSPASKAKKEDEDDIDLFGSDDDEEANAARDQRLKEYAEKKAKKPGPIAKSNVVLDIKPWDDETDMKALEQAVRSLEMNGLVWGVSKLVPVAYNIKKLQIVCVVEDEKVSIDELSEKITEFDDYVQSVDVAAFNKI